MLNWFGLRNMQVDVKCIAIIIISIVSPCVNALSVFFCFRNRKVPGVVGLNGKEGGPE